MIWLRLAPVLVVAVVIHLWLELFGNECECPTCSERARLGQDTIWPCPAKQR